MASRTALSELVENRSTLLEEALTRARAGEVQGGLFFDITFHYRLIAIASLLHDGDAGKFAQNLERSGRARLHYLKRVDRTAEGEAAFLCCSNEKGFEALAAAGDTDGARQIAVMQPDEMFPGVEYEEDFLFKRSLYALLDGGQDARASDLVQRLDRVESGSSEPLATIADALLRRDSARYSTALATLVERRRERFAELAQTPGFSREHLITERHVFVLGLAIERIAQVRGLALCGPPRLLDLERLPLRTETASNDEWMQSATS